MRKLISCICVAIALLLPGFAVGQDTAALLPNGMQQFLDNSGRPLAAGKVYFYTPGTTTKRTTWQDAEMKTANTNPVILDSAGRALIYGTSTYRQVVQTSAGVQIWDRLTAAPGSSSGGTAGQGDGLAVGAVLPYTGLTAPSGYMFAYGQAISRTTYADLLAAITITDSTATCISGTNTIAGLDSTEQIKVGAPIEISCLAPGTIVTGIASTTSVTVSGNATATGTFSAVFFPFGNGDGSTTFNLPDFRGRTIASPDNLGGVAANRLTSSAAGFGGLARYGTVGGNESQTLTTAQIPSHTHTATVTDPGHTHDVKFNVNQNVAVTGVTAMVSAVASGGTQTGSAAAVSNTTGITVSNSNTGGGNPHPIVQPTIIIAYIIKVETNGGSGVVNSIAGMTGSLNCGEGLLCAAQTIQVDIPGLTSLTTIDIANDYLMLYDASGNNLRKVSPEYLVAPLTAGVVSVGGMTGVITCGVSLACSSQSISATSGIAQYSVLVSLGASTPGFAAAAPGAAGNIMLSTGSSSNPAFTAPFFVSSREIAQTLNLCSYTVVQTGRYYTSQGGGGWAGGGAIFKKLNPADAFLDTGASFTDAGGCKWQYIPADGGIDARQFGVVWDWRGVDATAPDDLTALQNAIDFAKLIPEGIHPDNGGVMGATIWLPKGSGMICGDGLTSLQVDDGVQLIGQGILSTTIVVCDKWGAGTDVIVLGGNGNASFGTGLRQMQIWVKNGINANANAAVVRADDANHNSGLRDVKIFAGHRIGFRYLVGTGGASYVDLQDVEMYNEGGRDGFTNNPQIYIDVGTTMVRANNIVLQGPAAGAGGVSSVGLQIVGGMLDLTNFHSEGVAIPIDINIPLGGASEGAVRINNASGGHSCVTLIRFGASNLSGNTHTSGLFSNGCTDLVLNNMTGGVTVGTMDLYSPTVWRPNRMNLDEVSSVAASQGCVMYLGTTNLNCLTAGTSGTVLQSNGAGAAPTWTASPPVVSVAGGNGISITGTTSVTVTCDPSALAEVGCVFASNAVANQFLTGIDTAGNVTRAQPTVSNISGFGTGVATWLATPSSANLAAAMTDKTGSGLLVFADTPTLVTPVLGAATATSINGLTLTASTGTLTITNGKTLSVSNTLTFTGTDGSSVAFGTGGTVTYTSNNLSVFASTTSAQLAGVISDETGSGALVFASGPTFAGQPIWSLGGSATGRFGATSNYNVYSLNNSIALNGSLGILGGASGDDATLYLSAPTKVAFYLSGSEYYHALTTAFIPVADNARTLGDSTHTWSNVYVSLPAGAGTNSVCWDSTTKSMSNSGAGTCTVSTGRLKHIEGELIAADAIDMVQRLRPVRYHLLRDVSQTEQIGFVAEEAPDSRLIYLDANGERTGFRYEQYTAVLTAVVQELLQENARLNARLSRLEQGQRAALTGP